MVLWQFDHVAPYWRNSVIWNDSDKSRHADYLLTERGQLLRHLYSELDLVLAQAIDEGAFDGLDAPELASVLLYVAHNQEARGGSGEAAPPLPGGIQATLPSARHSCAAYTRDRHDVRGPCP